MSYTELEHGYQDLKSATSQPIFYVGDIGSVQQGLVGPVGSSIYRSSNRGELSDGCVNDDGCMGGSDIEGEGKQVLVGVCAMAKKSQSKPMKEILTRLEEFEYIKILVFAEEVILKEPVEDWPIVDCLISFHSKGFPLDKAIQYANLRNPFIINNLPMQYDIQDRRRVYAILEGEGIEIPRYAVLDRDSADPKQSISDHELVESEDHVEVNGVTFNKPFVEKPVSAEDHNIYIYYPTSAGGGSQRLFRKIGSRSSVYSPESRVRKTGSYIYEDFMPTDGTDVKVYTVGPDYAHAEARKSPALDGKVERDSEGKEIRYPVILSNAEKLISRKVCLAFKQTVCGFDLLRANGQSFVCDVNGFSFVKNSNKYYDDCAKILGNMILRELAPTLHIPWSVPFQLDDPPIVPTTFGKMMELRCVVAVIRHGDRTPKQKMKVEVRHPKFFEIFAKYDGYKHGHVKLKRPKQLQEILDTARSLLSEIQHRAAGPELEEKQGKLEQLKSVLEMYGHFSGINRKVQMKYQPRGRPRGSSSDDGNCNNRPGEPSLVLILKWGGELTPAGRIQAEELGRIFRCMYPGGQGRHLSGEYAGAQGLGLLRLHSTFRHDLKIYASDEGRVQMTAAAFAKGLLALEGELTPILVQMVKSANTNGLLDNDCDSSKYQNMVKNRLHELMQQDKEFTKEDREQINPTNALSINAALDFVKNPVRCCQHVHMLIQKLMDIVRIKKDDPKTKDAILYHGETWELMGRRWGKIEKDFYTKQKRFDISKIPDIYDCIKYDLQHNNHTLQFEHAEELYIYSKYLADIVIPQEYGLTVQEKLTIGQGICTPLLKKIRADLQRNIEEPGEETVNRLNPRYSHGVSSPGRHVRTRLYFTSESHVHSLLTVLRYGGLLDVLNDEQWRRAMEYVSMVSELNYMSQIVVMLYEDPTKDPSSEERFHVELHFSPGVNCCVQKNLPPGPGFRPHSRNESSHNLGEAGSGQDNTSQCSTRIEEEDTELGALEDDTTIPPLERDTSPPLMEVDASELDSTLDSPTTTSRAINMMDLDPNIMDEPYDSGFLQSSAPIPISARTVAGHEAARLGSQLAASQRQRRERDAGVIYEPRARSYDHQRQDKPEKSADKLQYQSLDAVNKEANSRVSRSPRCSEVFHEEPNVIFGLIKPIPSLAHSLSSPELVNPLTSASRNETDTGSSSSINLLLGSSIPPPLITLHNTPLASPGAVQQQFSNLLESLNATDSSSTTTTTTTTTTNNPAVSAATSIACSVAATTTTITTSTTTTSIITSSNSENIISNSLAGIVVGSGLRPDQQLPKRYGRSHSALNLPVIEINGESVPSSSCLSHINSNKQHRASQEQQLDIDDHDDNDNDDDNNDVEDSNDDDEPVIHHQSDNPKRRVVVVVNSPSGSSSLFYPSANANPTTTPTGAFRRPRSPHYHHHHHHHLLQHNSQNCQHYFHHTHPNNYNPPHQHHQTPPQLVVARRFSGSSASLGCSPQYLTARRFSGSSASLNSTQHYYQQRIYHRHSSVSPNQLEALADALLDKRSRSLSPGRCTCYNCNVSELIMQSRDLSPAERSNFRTYFARSLSHKFSNCSCYSLSRESPNSNPSSPGACNCYDEPDDYSESRENREADLTPACSHCGYVKRTGTPRCWSGSCPELGPASCDRIRRSDSLDSIASSISSNSSSNSSSAYSSCSTNKLHLSCSLDCLRTAYAVVDTTTTTPARDSFYTHSSCCYHSCYSCKPYCCMPTTYLDAAGPSRNYCQDEEMTMTHYPRTGCVDEFTTWPGCKARGPRRRYSRHFEPGRGRKSHPHPACNLGCYNNFIEQHGLFNCKTASSPRSPCNYHHHHHHHYQRPSSSHCCNHNKHQYHYHHQHQHLHQQNNCRHHHHNHQQQHHHHYHHQHYHHQNLHSPLPFLRKLQQQRSFSSPDTRPSLIQPDPTCTARRHRHSISGQMSYFKLLGYNVNKKLTGSANSLFSTAVISGSSSAPNLKDMVPAHASAVAAIEGFGGVPPIRPLETLHNALSLRQLDAFLEMMTSVPLFRTPASSPPKFPSPLEPGATTGPHQNLAIEAARYITPNPIHYKSTHDNELGDLRSQLSPTSPNSTGWSSEPPSFLSSEPSSPAPTSAGECSMSMSLVSNDGSQSFATGPKYSPNRGLELDYSDFCVNVEHQQPPQHQPTEQQARESRGSVSYTDYYSSEDGQIRRTANDNCFPIFKPQHMQNVSTPTTIPPTNTAASSARQSTDEEEPPEEDENAHTLTLKQSDEQKKQDVQHIFEQKENQAAAAAAAAAAAMSIKPSSSYKKIGRFRVESMEITDEDVRIKEPVSLGSSVVEKSSRSKPEAPRRSNSLLRSQSVYTPKFSTSSGSRSPLLAKQSSLSGGSSEPWQDSPPPKPIFTKTGNESEDEPVQPVLTLASSFTDKANVTFGFDVNPQERKD